MKMHTLILLASLGIVSGSVGQTEITVSEGNDRTAEIPAAGVIGKVLETLEAGRYTYVRVDAGGDAIWAAAPRTDLQVGDTVHVPPGLPMRDSFSQALQRKFDLVYFVDRIAPVSDDHPPVRSAPPLPARHPVPGFHHPQGAFDTSVDLSGIAPPEGGSTIAELLARKRELAEQRITARGRVVKFTPAVMDRNWVHIRDGSGKGAAADLTVTTDDTAAVGDTVRVEGALRTDRDFGHGFRYDVLIEDARVTVEEKAALGSPERAGHQKPTDTEKERGKPFWKFW